MNVRTRYRGIGVGEGMMRMALESASNEGARKVNLFVFECNKPALNLYKKMGFMQASIYKPNDQFERKFKFRENHRIMMTKIIANNINNREIN